MRNALRKRSRKDNMKDSTPSAAVSKGMDLIFV